MKHCIDYRDVRWSKWLESVRKDVECTFGILKKRFKLLKIGMLYQDQQKCDNAFMTCCVLHNMLLTEDGLDERWTEEVENWHTGEFDEPDELEIAQMTKVNNRVEAQMNQNKTDESRTGRGNFGEYQKPNFGTEEVTADDDISNWELKEKLVDHFHIQFRNGNVRWLK